MNIKNYTYYLLLFLPALLLTGCAQEDDMPAVAGDGADSGIVLRVSLPDAEARSNATTTTADMNGGFYVSAICPEDDASAGNVLDPYFSDRHAMPMAGRDGYFGIFDDPASEPYVWSTTRHGKQGKLKFFAYYPSGEVLKSAAGLPSGANNFGLKNYSKKQGSTVTYDYRMENFKIGTDISRHIDFVTATAEGSRRADGDTGAGVNLAFEHQLSRVALNAWGNTTSDIEIAGVRIGRVITESSFNFAAQPKNLASGDNTVNGNWVTPQVRDCVEYIFREGDTVVKVGTGGHTSAASAASIMGNGGWAMVIPADYTGWNHKSDAPNRNNGLYFSVLMRVKENDPSKTLVYPYIEGADMSATVTTDGMTVIYLAIERATGKVMTRLYRSGTGNYFTDPGFTTAYTVPATVEIRNYGWAAVPLTTLRWKPGYQYVYTLDYSKGVGVHDPFDPYPGRPIISDILVGVTESGNTSWHTVNDFKNDEGSDVDVTGQITIE
ncbi:MAG: fimbrillin family protein [Muribaculaceae bacterium]|nr:fimbrillin family protein [Muribaculaceae bacterium]